jgi:hypothetical protein
MKAAAIAMIRWASVGVIGGGSIGEFDEAISPRVTLEGKRKNHAA